MVITPNMSLTAWTSSDDDFDHTQLATNFALVDGHDHSPGKGTQLNAAEAIVNETITDALIAAATITGDKIADETITAALIANNTITAAQIANNTITSSQISNSAGITLEQLAAGVARLTVSTKTSAFTAADGNLYEVSTAGVAVTLPTPTSGSLISIWNGGDFATSPTAITASSGVILGNGVLSTSMDLGAGGAYVTLYANGTDWFIVGGGLDTGWVSVTLANGWTNSVGYYPASYRVIEDRVWLRGSPNVPSSDVVGFTLPVGARPASPVILDAGQYAVATNGQVSNEETDVQITFDGVSFSLT
jgi:hypothetical protein